MDTVVGGRLEKEEVSQTPSHASPNQQAPALGPDQLWWLLAQSCSGQGRGGWGGCCDSAWEPWTGPPPQAQARVGLRALRVS